VQKYPLKSAIETLLIGGTAAAIAFLVGYFLRILIG
jgi:VIT1/CCC1 family predicted Fe2+/Mn2+ transporter